MAKAKELKGSGIAKARNFLYLAACLLWAFAGLDGALSQDLGTQVFAWVARAGALSLVAALLLELAKRFFERDTLERMYEARKVTRGELVDAREFSMRFLPEVPPLEQLERIFEASRGCVWFVNESRHGFGLKRIERVGFFSLIRLTQAAVQLYEHNNLNSFQLDRTHIAGPRNAAPALYVGGLGARGFRARGWIVQYLRSRIDSFFEQGGKVVFTRPVTDDGLRLAEKLGFRPVDPARRSLGSIYKLEP